jgi:predicted Zn-dependent protease
MKHSLRFTALATTAFALAVAFPLAAQSQDASKVLNMFQGLINPGQPQQAPAAPAQVQQPQANPAAGLTNMFSGGGAAAMPLAQNNNQAARGAELIGLLSQSLEQIDQPKEIEIGRQLAAVLLGSKPLYPDMLTQRYVNQLGRWISLQSSRPDLPWTFAVLDDPGFNAFAAPGGYVFITKGTLDRVADEAELAGILAHEINHVTGKHHLQAMRKTARAGLLTQAIGAKLAGNNALAGAISSQMLALGKDLYSKGLDQDDELEADRNAVVLAARAGFDPYGLVSVIQQLRGSAADPLFALSLSTHPAAQLRLDQLEQAMGKRLDGLSGKPSITVAQRMASMTAAEQRVQAAQAAPVAGSKPAPANKAPASKKKQQ